MREEVSRLEVAAFEFLSLLSSFMEHTERVELAIGMAQQLSDEIGPPLRVDTDSYLIRFWNAFDISHPFDDPDWDALQVTDVWPGSWVSWLDIFHLDGCWEAHEVAERTRRALERLQRVLCDATESDIRSLSFLLGMEVTPTFISDFECHTDSAISFVHFFAHCPFANDGNGEMGTKTALEHFNSFVNEVVSERPARLISEVVGEQFEEIKWNPSQLKYLMSAHLRLCRLRSQVKNDSNLVNRSSDEEPRRMADGPIEPDCFAFGGNVYEGMRDKSWGIVKFLWDAKAHTASFDELAEHVWGDIALRHLDEEQFGSARRDANHFFDDHALPFKVAGMKAPSGSGRIAKLRRMPQD